MSGMTNYDLSFSYFRRNTFLFYLLVPNSQKSLFEYAERIISQVKIVKSQFLFIHRTPTFKKPAQNTVLIKVLSSEMDPAEIRLIQ